MCLSVTFSEAVLSLCNVGQLSLLSRSLSTSPMHLKLFLTLIPSALQSFSPPCLCLSLSRPSSVSSLINCCCSHAVFFFSFFKIPKFPTVDARRGFTVGITLLFYFEFFFFLFSTMNTSFWLLVTLQDKMEATGRIMKLALVSLLPQHSCDF